MKIKFLLGSFLFATTEARCPEGFNEESIAGGFQCIDIDECKQGTHICHSDANCSNTEGSYACECEQGKR